MRAFLLERKASKEYERQENEIVQGGDGHFFSYLLNLSASIRNLQLFFASDSIKLVV